MAKNVDLERIINGCKRGDNESYSQLVEVYSGRLFGYFYRLTGDKDVSEELLSQIFIRLVKKMRSYKGGVFESWLFRIASNIFYDYLRDKQRRKLLAERHRANLEENREIFNRSGTEIFDKLQINLGRLDEETRELITLRFYSQLSFKEIAALRSEPLGTVLSKIHRGLKRLRELME